MEEKGFCIPVMFFSRSKNLAKLFPRSLCLDGHFHLNRCVRFVAHHFKVIKRKVVDALHLAPEAQLGKRLGRALQLLAQRFDVVQVDVRIAQCVHKVARLQTGNVRNHVRQQRVAGDIERYAQAHVCAALVQLARQLSVGHVELDETVARWQRHFGNVHRIPGAHDHASIVRVAANAIDHVLQLVDSLT